MELFTKSINSCLAELKTSPQGLSNEEARRREILSQSDQIAKAKKPSILKLFLKQFADLMIMILLLSAAVSFVIGIVENSTSEIVDGCVILFIVFANAIFGLMQENKAEKSMQLLQKMTQPETTVLRESEQRKIFAEKIVPGDIVVLESGSIVPADCRLIESVGLCVDESSLTGESMPVEKDCNFLCRADSPLPERKNMVFNGTTVVKGRGLGVVSKIGKTSELGKMAGVIGSAKKEMSPLQKDIKNLGKVSTFLILAMALVTFIIELAAGFKPLDAFLTAVAISVAAIPESMPAVITIIMSLGIARLAKQKAIVKQIHSVETLGCCDVICSDKTGTITQNKMSVKAVFCDNQLLFSNFDKAKDFSLLLQTMSLCNDCHKNGSHYVGEPTEKALVEFAKLFGSDKAQLENSFKRIGEIPFDSERKLMSCKYDLGNQKTIFVKGAVDKLLNCCSKILINGISLQLSNERRSMIEKAHEKMSSNALRVLGFAIKNLDDGIDENELTFVGMVGLMDPPRKEVFAAVQKCKQAGMRAVMITGDHYETAFAIAKEIGLATSKKQVMSGAEIDKLDDESFLKKLDNINVFARVSPENKVRIVEGFKKKGHIVAMTGDGVNDAASMKKANIGIGMGKTGTDVTKEVADLIVTDDNFATIVIAVEEGRKVYKNIQKTVKFLFSANMGEIMALFFATIIFPQYVFLLPLQILFVNLITDSLPAIALGAEPAENDLMSSKPRRTESGIFGEGNGWSIVIMGLVQTFLTISTFCLGIWLYNPQIASTMAFYTLNIVQFFYLLSIRTEASFFKSNPFKNKWCIISCAFAGVVLMLIALTPLRKILHLTSLNFVQMLFILVSCLVMFFASEICKFVLRKKHNKQK